MMIDQMLSTTRDAFVRSPPVGDDAYRRYCRELADGLSAGWPQVLEANGEDVAAARQRGLPDALLDRLRLGAEHLPVLQSLCATVHDALPAVTGGSESVPAGGWGSLRRVPKPLGVILMVYEARPTVTLEGALLPVAVGNAVLLRGGKEMAATDRALARVAKAALEAAGLPPDLVTVLEDPSRSVLRELLSRPEDVDVLLPRGSPSLIEYCRTASSIPVVASGGGVNHMYVHRSADLDLAARATLDSKLAEPTACNTLELVLVDREVAGDYVDALAEAVRRQPDPVAVRLGEGLDIPAGPDAHFTAERLGSNDLGREYLDRTVGVLAVDGMAEALAHVREHGSAHTEGVIASDDAVVDEYVRGVDAAAIVTNGSLRLHDGPTLGLGPEISISTGRLHVRGPVTLGGLLTHSWVVDARASLRGDLG